MAPPPNAGAHLPPEAEATQEHRLLASAPAFGSALTRLRNHILGRDYHGLPSFSATLPIYAVTP